MVNKGIDIRQILGLKVRELRNKKHLSFQELSKVTGLSVSYLNEIEKGKKYPKGDKIIQLAEALDVSYDYLVSLKVSKKIEPIVSLLQSPFFRELPLEHFGMDTQKFVELISASPEKINAFINTIMQVARSYELGRENIYHAVLRSYQEINDNYFPELEQAVVDFKQKFDFEGRADFTIKNLTQTLKDYFGITVEYEQLASNKFLTDIRSYYNKEKMILSVNKNLTEAQEKFLIVRELAFQFMEHIERPAETPPQRKHSFTELLNNFKASYFSVAFLMDKDEVISDIKNFVKSRKWFDQDVLSILKKYDATPEMLMQRLTNILPSYFGFNNLFFLKMVKKPDNEGYKLTKELHLSKLHNPYGNELDEHYCRRWISVRILSELSDSKVAGPIARLQISKYFNTINEYLCLSIAIPNSSNEKEVLSITVGFQLDKKFKDQIDFLDSASIVEKEVHTTCERCPIADCAERAVPAWKLNKLNQDREIEKALESLN